MIKFRNASRQCTFHYGTHYTAARKYSTFYRMSLQRMPSASPLNNDARVRSSRYGSTLKGKTGMYRNDDGKGASTTMTTAMSQFVASSISHAALGVTGTAGRMLHFSLAGRIGESGFLGYCQVSRTWRIPVSAYFSVGISGEIRRPRDIEQLYLIYSMTFLRLCSISADIEVLFLHCIHTLYFIVIIYCYYLFRKKNCKSNTRVFNFLDFRSISPSLVRQGNVNFNLLI